MLGMSGQRAYGYQAEKANKTKSQDLDYMLTAETRRRAIPNLKRLYDLMGKPGMISLAGGTPNYSIFPFDGVGSTSLSPPFANGISEPKLSSGNKLKFTVFENYGDEEAGSDGGDIELSTALQYGPAIGDDRLRNFLKGHVKEVHDVGFTDWDLILTVGNTCAWDTVLRVFCEPTDVILCEQFTFPSALENARTRGCDVYGVRGDEYGIIPEDLEYIAGKYRPKLLYTIPTGQNPTGTVIPAMRRKQIMEIARKYDFLVVEDEPYYYLQMVNIPALYKKTDPKGARERFLASLVPSFLEYDTDGRVIRLDSFSKIMAPGIRMGWIVAQQRFTDAIRKTLESSCSKPSGFAQTLVYGVLRRWGQDGFIDWLMGLREEYTERRDLCCKTLKENLGESSCHVNLDIPHAGMFFWFSIDLGPPTPGKDRDLAQYEEEFFDLAADSHEVLVVPGNWCEVDKKLSRDEYEQNLLYFRGTFASESKETIVAGAKRLATAISDYLKTNVYELADESNVAEPFDIVKSPK